MNKIKSFSTFLIMVIVFIIFAECLTRLFFSFINDLDIEMWKYSQRIKKRVANPKIVFFHKPNIEEKLYGVDIKINSKGLRSPEYNYSKKTGTGRILVIGDCMTFGWGVEYQDTFPALLEHKLNESSEGKEKFEVINFGIGNYNLIQEANLFLQEGYKYDADLYIINYFLNDLEPTPSMKTSYILENSMLAVLLWSRLQNITSLFKMNNDSETYYQSLYNSDLQAHKEAWGAFGLMIEDMKRRGCKIIVNILPVLNNLSGEKYPYKNIHKATQDEMKKYDIIVIDLADVFFNKDEKSLWVSEFDTHYNKNAFMLMVENNLPIIEKIFERH